MKRLNVNKSTGVDNINVRFPQLCTPSLVSSLTLIINASIQTSVFPSVWKIAKVTALHKSGSDTELNNYRPISVLNAVTKIIERHVKSKTLNLLNGIPQGSILGPLIFSIYINELPLNLYYVNSDLYSDDTTLYVADKDIDNIQVHLSHDLDIFSKRCLNNKLIINTKKSKCIVICTRQRLKYVNKKLLLYVNNSKLDCVDDLKILGLTIDKNLSWKPHINNICSKLSCLIGLMWRIRNYMSYKMELHVL